MTGNQIYVLVLLLGGVVALGVALGALFTGLGFYYRGKNSGKNRDQDESN